MYYVEKDGYNESYRQRKSISHSSDKKRAKQKMSATKGDATLTCDICEQV